MEQAVLAATYAGDRGTCTPLYPYVAYLLTTLPFICTCTPLYPYTPKAVSYLLTTLPFICTCTPLYPHTPKAVTYHEPTVM